MAGTTWNPADLAGGLTLSGGNLVATASLGQAGVRSVANLTTGKNYWECTYTAIASNGFGVGVALSTYNLTGGTSTAAALMLRLGGSISVNGAGTGSSIGTINTGNVVGIAADFTGKLIWFRIAPSGNWNGSGTADPGTGAGGVSFSALGGALYALMISQGSGDVCTANFGDTAFTGAVPSGFTTGIPTGGAATVQARVMVLA